MFVLTYVGSVWKNTGQLGDPGTLRTVCVRSICAMLPVSKQAPWMNWLNKSLAGYGFLIWNCEYGFLIWNCEAFVFFFFFKASRYPNQETSVPEQEVWGKKIKATPTACQALWSSLMVSSSEDIHTVITIHRVRGLVEHTRKIGRGGIKPLCHHGSGPLLDGRAGQEAAGRNWSRGLGGTLVADFLPRACSVCFLLHPRVTCLGMALLTYTNGLSYLYQLSIKNMLQSQSYINPCSFFLDNPNLYYTVKLTKTTTTKPNKKPSSQHVAVSEIVGNSVLILS